MRFVDQPSLDSAYTVLNDLSIVSGTLCYIERGAGDTEHGSQ